MYIYCVLVWIVNIHDVHSAMFINILDVHTAASIVTPQYQHDLKLSEVMLSRKWK